MSQRVKIKIDGWDGKMEGEFEASDEVVEILKRILLQNFYIVH